jgi:hypothetical protein
MRTTPAPPRSQGSDCPGCTSLCEQRALCRLRVDDLQTDADGHTVLRLGRTPLTLPQAVAEIAQRAAESAVDEVSRVGVSIGFTDSPVWLFPGLPMTKPADPTTLRSQLDPVLVGSVRAHRSTALLTLAGEIPPVVLADLLGLHRGTADLWRYHAGGGPAAYTAARLSDLARNHDDVG